MLGWLVQFLRPRVEAPQASPALATPAQAYVLGELHELAETWKTAEELPATTFAQRAAMQERADTQHRCGRELAKVLERGDHLVLQHKKGASQLHNGADRVNIQALRTDSSDPRDSSRSSLRRIQIVEFVADQVAKLCNPYVVERAERIGAQDDVDGIPSYCRDARGEVRLTPIGASAVLEVNRLDCRVAIACDLAGKDPQGNLDFQRDSGAGVAQGDHQLVRARIIIYVLRDDKPRQQRVRAQRSSQLEFLPQTDPGEYGTGKEPGREDRHHNGRSRCDLRAGEEIDIHCAGSLAASARSIRLTLGSDDEQYTGWRRFDRRAANDHRQSTGFRTECLWLSPNAAAAARQGTLALFGEVPA